MEKIKNLYEVFLSLILPKDTETLYLESLTEDEILFLVPRANEIDDDKYKAIFQYKNKIARQAIWEIKYRANKNITRKFSKILYEFILEELSDQIAFSNFNNPLLIPIPASKNSLREKGFNQSELIAREMKKIDGGKNFEINLNALNKIKETPHQSKLKNKEKRLKNLKGCFSADANLVNKRCIILIDDVITTGATFKEVEKTLKNAGAKKIIGFTIAH